MVAWVCGECDERWEETGTGSGFGKALAHSNRQNAGHTIQGLVDLDTGELLVPGLNRPRAEQGGWIQRPAKKDLPPGPDKTERLTSTPAVGDRDPVHGASAKRATTGPPFSGTVKGLQIEFPLYIAAYAAMVMARLTDPDTGEPYPFTAEGMAKCLTDVLRLSFQRLVPVALGLTARQLADAAVRERVAALIATIEAQTDTAEVVALTRRLYASAFEEP
jgi:hypothetical protein